MGTFTNITLLSWILRKFWWIGFDVIFLRLEKAIKKRYVFYHLTKKFILNGKIIIRPLWLHFILLLFSFSKKFVLYRFSLQKWLKPDGLLNLWAWPKFCKRRFQMTFQIPFGVTNILKGTRKGGVGSEVEGATWLFHSPFQVMAVTLWSNRCGARMCRSFQRWPRSPMTRLTSGALIHSSFSFNLRDMWHLASGRRFQVKES